MRLSLTPKGDLSPEQFQYLEARLAAPEHQNDRGTTQAWAMNWSCLYAFVHKQLGVPVGISAASGRPMAVPGWWIDKKYRGKGYGNELIDLLADFLVADGVTQIGVIPIDTYNGEYHEQSSRLARRLRIRFAEALQMQQR